MPVSNLTLMKIAAIGGFVTAGMGFALRFKLDDQIAQTEYYKEALKSLRAHPGAVHVLGEPIKVGRIDVSDNKTNWTRSLLAQYAVPVRGPKKKGIMYFWAHKKIETNNWSVHRIELELKDDPTKRLLVKNERL